MAPTPTASPTLISCYPDLVDRRRMVVFADWTAETLGWRLWHAPAPHKHVVPAEIPVLQATPESLLGHSVGALVSDFRQPARGSRPLALSDHRGH